MQLKRQQFDGMLWDRWGTEVNTALLIVSTGTFVVALLTLLAAVTGWLKRKVPVDCGFLMDGSMVTDLKVSTGDSAKPVVIRLRNKSKTTVTGLVVDMRFLQPLSLSATSTALSLPPGNTEHGRVPDGSYYLVRRTDFDLSPEETLDFRVELNMSGLTPGTARVQVTVYSTQQDYKYRKSSLILHIS